MYQIESFLTFLTSDKGQPLNKGQNGQKTMGPMQTCPLLGGSTQSNLDMLRT